MVSGEPVVVVPYDEAWPALFKRERIRIQRAIDPWAEQIEHIGSTAVPGLAAKPILNILIGVRSLRDADCCIEPLERLGYEYRGEAGVPGRRFFRKGNPKTHHLHLADVGSEFWESHLLFRDYLRTHPETAQEYARLKHHLAEHFREDRAAYTEAKTVFISGVVRRAKEDRGT